MASSISSRNSEKLPYSHQRILQECRQCLNVNLRPLGEKGDRFLEYFQKNATPEGVLFRTIREMTADLNMPHQTLTKILKTLEDHKLIYRRNGIIGLWKK